MPDDRKSGETLGPKPDFDDRRPERFSMAEIKKRLAAHATGPTEDEPTYRCRSCLDRGFVLRDCADPKRLRMNAGQPFQVAAACQSCDRGIAWAAGHWRQKLESDSGLAEFAAWSKREPFFASRVRAVIDAGDPKPRHGP